MKKQIKQFKILDIKRGNNSYYGNPSYYLVLTDENNNIFFAKTASNASIAYEIGKHWVDTKKTLQYHITSSGNMIIDYYKRDCEVI